MSGPVIDGSNFIRNKRPDQAAFNRAAYERRAIVGGNNYRYSGIAGLVGPGRGQGDGLGKVVKPCAVRLADPDYEASQNGLQGAPSDQRPRHDSPADC
jgi:hypothetical protein